MAPGFLHLAGTVPESGTGSPKDIEGEVRRCREAQSGWAGVAVSERLRTVRRFRRSLPAAVDDLVESVAAPRRPGETMTAEVLPLGDACRFLEKEARRILRPERPGRRGRPRWLGRIDLEIRREPIGVVLIIAPSNYPLLLPGVQALQALVAGNGVLLKPAPGCSAAAHVLRRLLVEAGLDERLLRVLPDTVEAARAAMAAGVDHVLLTGSARSGRKLLEDLAPRLTPATLELSGCDAVFVREDADMDVVGKALRFGLQLNGGRTCIAPRRVLVHRLRAHELEARLVIELEAAGEIPIAAELQEEARLLVLEAVKEGARLVAGSVSADTISGPIVLADASADMRLLSEDLCAPVISIVPVADDHAALEADAKCPYALGASVFGSQAEAFSLAGRIRAGVVVIGDVIVPTADPRLPFGGRGESGFGTTRGAEGLLELTVPKAIALRRGRWRPHLDPPHPEDELLFRNYLVAAHGKSLLRRLAACLRFVNIAARRGRKSGKPAARNEQK